MKTVLVKIEGELKPGDMLIVSHEHPRGGRGNARFDVPPEIDRIVTVNGHKTVETTKTTMREAISRLVTEANKWDGFKAVQRNDNEFVVQCSDAVDVVKFFNYSTGGQKVTIEELG